MHPPGSSLARAPTIVRPGSARRTSRPAAAGRAFVGISGWRYAGWRKVFYPEGLAQSRELQYASRRFNSIEINGTFYSLQLPESFRRWAAEVPDGFVFAVKGGRFITHMKKLRDVETALANFFASGVLELGDRLGPILWQLPPNLACEPDRLGAFFDLLPRDTSEAARLARRHDDRVAPPRRRPPGAARPLRHALEVRHPSCERAELVELLRAHGVALVVADTAGRWPLMEDVTADFVYVRLHGDAVLYVSGYSDEALDRWAARVAAWRAGKQAPDARLVAPRAPDAPAGRDVYVYFDNDAKVRAPFDAAGLARRIGLCSPGREPDCAPPDVEPESSEARSAEMAARWRRRVRAGREGPDARRPR